MNEVSKPRWVNTKWREVEWATTIENKHLDYWHPDLFQFVDEAMQCARDTWQDEKIDVRELSLEEEENQYFVYLSGILSGEYISAETAAIARKFFKSLGVEW